MLLRDGETNGMRLVAPVSLAGLVTLLLMSLTKMNGNEMDEKNLGFFLDAIRDGKIDERTLLCAFIIRASAEVKEEIARVVVDFEQAAFHRKA